MTKSSLYPILIIVVMGTCTTAFADTSNVIDFRVTYHQDPGIQAPQEAQRGAQRALELQSEAGELMTLRRTLKNGAHEVRSSNARTRAEAWKFAEKLQRDNPNIVRVEPIDPNADQVHGIDPVEQGGAK